VASVCILKRRLGLRGGGSVTVDAHTASHELDRGDAHQGSRHTVKAERGKAISGAAAREPPRAGSYALAAAVGMLTALSFSIESWPSCRRVASIRSVSCASLVALAMGAVTPGCAINQARATRPGVDW
jgi:hypothetical protein